MKTASGKEFTRLRKGTGFQTGGSVKAKVWMCLPPLEMKSEVAVQGSCGGAFSSVAQSCPTLFYPMNCSTPGLPVHHQLPEST